MRKCFEILWMEFWAGSGIVLLGIFVTKDNVWKPIYKIGTLVEETVNVVVV